MQQIENILIVQPEQLEKLTRDWEGPPPEADLVTSVMENAAESVDIVSTF